MKNTVKGKKMKSKKMKGKDFKGRAEMKEILEDSRFAHVPFDPKFRHMPKEERKVKLDDRFSSMFSDKDLYKKNTMDPRGRTVNFSTKENLHKFYHMSSDESESDEGEDKVDDDDDEEETDSDDKEGEELEESNKILKEEDDLPSKDNAEITEDILERLKDLTQDYARGTDLFPDDSSDDDSSTEEEEEGEEFEWGELDQDAVWDTEQDVEETSRIAVCNLDWNHIKAIDIMVVFHSFCPRGGSIKKVTIYPSEFGKQRMAEEDRFGPKELTTLNSSSSNINDNDVDLERLEKGKLSHKSEGSQNNFEALRRYERNRLKYYYAVVECDSVDTAMVLYKECDGHSFERAGVFMDLRYIPDDMTFEEEPHDTCDAVPEFYESKLFTTTALFDSRPILTWDQTDPHRAKVLSQAMQDALSGKDYNEDYLKNFIASSSDEESDQAPKDDSSSDEEEEDKNKRIANFRALLQEIDEKEKKKKAGLFDMETVFGIKEEKDDSGCDDSDDEEEEEEKSDLKPFERYLEKKRNKRKEKKMKNKEKDNNNEETLFSDDELPEDIKNDSFFAEEMKGKEQREKGKLKKKKKKGIKLETEEEGEDKGDLELLLMDEDLEEKKHFNMRDIIDKHKGKSKKKLKKKDKLKLKKLGEEKITDDFKVDTSDPRFANLFKSGEYSIDPSHPQFKRTKAVDELITNVQKKRMAESFETTPEPKRQNTAKGKDELELSMLVKRVKSKAKK